MQLKACERCGALSTSSDPDEPCQACTREVAETNLVEVMERAPKGRPQAVAMLDAQIRLCRDQQRMLKDPPPPSDDPMVDLKWSIERAKMVSVLGNTVAKLMREWANLEREKSRMVFRLPPVEQIALMVKFFRGLIRPHQEALLHQLTEIYNDRLARKKTLPWKRRQLPDDTSSPTE